MTEQATGGTGQWQRQGLSATSFAVLGLLSLQEWTTYELAQQMRRSFSYFWPRAERRIYDEPKRLADAGYVRARHEVVGRRPRTCWTITDEGRAALRRWLAEPPAGPPSLEFEGMLKVFLAQAADKKQLLATLGDIAETAAEQRHALARMCRDLADDGGQFPHRIHINALAMEYMLGVTELTEQWARHARELADGWRSVPAPGPAGRAQAREFFTAHAVP